MNRLMSFGHFTFLRGSIQAFLVMSVACFVPTAVKGESDKLYPLEPGAVQLQGSLGESVDLCIKNRILRHPTNSLVEIFKSRTQDVFGYHGEFIGKWLSGAALACRYKKQPELQEKMRKAALDLVGAASEDGYLSTYLPKDYFRSWDIWNQKYVLLGLIAQYDYTGDKAYLQAAKATADYVLSKHGLGKLSIEEYGPAAHKGGCNFSILEPIALLYRRTGEKRYLDFANYIVESWSRPGKHSPAGVRLIENAESGLPLVQGEILHCYVYMSCFEGLCELYRCTGNKRFLDAAVKAARQISREELTVMGSMGNFELWCSTALTQTEVLEKPMETCATATWIKLCGQLLRSTGDPEWADYMEVSLYNALLGAMMPLGEWWCYESSLSGERMPSRVQGHNISCCVSSGPRGLLFTPQWASMLSNEGDPVINLYSQGVSAFRLADDCHLTITQETDYPASSTVRLVIEPQKAREFTLKLRIPRWSKQTALQVNGESVAGNAGSYATIRREWKQGDLVNLDFDFRGRIIRAPSGAPQQAIMRGPIVLAMDSRLIKEEVRNVWLITTPLQWKGAVGKIPGQYILPASNFPREGEDAFAELRQIDTGGQDIRMMFEVPFVVRGAAFGYQSEKLLKLCDYASAGNQWSSDNLYRVWMPQPMFLGNAFSRNTWQIQASSTRERKEVPEPFRLSKPLP